MGLISAIAGAAAGALADSWREYFYCDSLATDVLVAKGVKRTGKRSTNTKGDDNIISKGSIIAVNEGQCMILVDQGKVSEICAEPGEFVYDDSTEPSLFYGKLGESIKETFQQIGRRFTFGGEPAKDQRVYFVNIKEIMGNKYGTPAPVPFRVVDANANIDLDITVKCNGEYSYKITDPIIFYQNVCGNVTDTFTRDKIDEQLKSELLTALQPTFAKISEMGIRYSQIPAKTEEIAKVLNENLTEKWGKQRGVSIANFGINSIKASEEYEEMISTLQKGAALKDATLAAGVLADAQAEAMKNAAKNENGSMMAFAGLNMANNAGGMNAQNLYAVGAQQQAAAMQNQQTAQPQQAAAGWTCACGKVNDGKFCTECGSPKPSSDVVCPKCGKAAPAGTKFCPECGTQLN